MPQHASSGLTILALTAVFWSGGWRHTRTSQFEDVIVSIKNPPLWIHGSCSDYVRWVGFAPATISDQCQCRLQGMFE
jgi:hypothetical protein